MRLPVVAVLAAAVSCSTADPGGREPILLHVECAADTVLARWLPEGDRSGNEYNRGNTFGMVVWWEGPSSLERALVVANLEPTRRPGTATNAGNDRLPDFHFEQDLNVGWNLELDDTAKIEGVQSLGAWLMFPRGIRVPLRVSTFDWGGSFSVTFIIARPDGSEVGYVRFPGRMKLTPK